MGQIINMKEVIENSNKTNVFPPVCPVCGNTMVWQSDFMLSEIGYVDPDIDEDEDRVVHVFAGPECECSADFEDLEDNGNMVELSHTELFPDEPEKMPATYYTDYAGIQYGMEDYDPNE